MTETYKRRSELVAVTLTDIGEARKWHEGEIVTLKWEHMGLSGVGEFRIVSARHDRHSAHVSIDLEAVDA